MYACCTYAPMNTKASMFTDMLSHNALMTVVSAEGLHCNLCVNRPRTSQAKPFFMKRPCENVEPLVLGVSS